MARPHALEDSPPEPVSDGQYDDSHHDGAKDAVAAEERADHVGDRRVDDPTQDHVGKATTVVVSCVVIRDLIKHAIETIRDIGSVRSLATLRALSKDPAFGADAVRALATLQRRGIGVA
jgi:hypothetical protein